MKESGAYMGAAFCGAAVGVIQAIQNPGVMNASLLMGTLKMAGYVVSGVLVFGILFWIGYAAEEHFVRDEDSKTDKTVKRLGMLAVWCIVVAVLAGRAGLGV